MARRRRTLASAALTPARMLALTIGPAPGRVQDPDELLEALWWKHRDRLLADATPRTLPWGWWQFEGPPELREGRPALVDVDDAAGLEAQRRHRDELATARAAWLANAGRAA
jgi:hypothetical protein